MHRSGEAHTKFRQTIDECNGMKASMGVRFLESAKKI